MRAARLMGRREWLGSVAAAAAGCLWAPRLSAAPLRSRLSALERHLEVVHVRRTTVRVPYRPVPARNMARELPHWMYSEICEVELKGGVVGVGETLLYYTWGPTTDEAVQRVLGHRASDFLWHDSLGAGLQIALFDAVARLLEVPIHRLLGHQQHRRTPLSWWSIDMPPEDMVAECQEAFQRGYRAYKTKGRPWFDVWAQVEAIAKTMPSDFKVDLDFNDTLLDASRAIPILRELERYPQVGIFETPIPQEDITGNRALCEAIRTPIAMHYGNPPPMVALREGICDGFVVSGGVSTVLKIGAVLETADKPFWLQLVGTGITAAFCLHLAAVLSHAIWPAVNCHQLYEHSLLTREIPVEDGYAPIPQEPGLGYELDRGALERYRVSKPAQRPEPPRLIRIFWPDGRSMYVASTGQVNFLLDLARQGKIPYFERGVRAELVPDDGSAGWKALYDRARRGPVLEKP